MALICTVYLFQVKSDSDLRGDLWEQKIIADADNAAESPLQEKLTWYSDTEVKHINLSCFYNITQPELIHK